MGLSLCGRIASNQPLHERSLSACNHRTVPPSNDFPVSRVDTFSPFRRPAFHTSASSPLFGLLTEFRGASEPPERHAPGAQAPLRGEGRRARGVYRIAASGLNANEAFACGVGRCAGACNAPPCWWRQCDKLPTRSVGIRIRSSAQFREEPLSFGSSRNDYAGRPNPNRVSGCHGYACVAMSCRDTGQHAYASVSMAPKPDARLRRLALLAWPAYYGYCRDAMYKNRGLRPRPPGISL